MKFVKRGTVVLLVTMAIILFTAFLTGQPALARDPEVDEHYPDGGDRDVPIGISIWVEFDADMDKDTVVDGMTLRDEDGRDVSGKISYNNKERRAYFKPSKKLDYDTRYRVRLSSSIEDVNGDNIRSYSFYFTTMRYPQLVVNGMDVPEEGLNVNVSPVDIAVDAPGAKEVVFGAESLERRVRSYYLNNYHLKPGKNNLSFKVTYEYEDEKGKTKQETLSLSRGINLVNTLDEGAVITHDLSKSNKISYFDKQLNIVLPGGFYLRQGGVAAGSQLLAFKTGTTYSVNGSPAVSYVFNIAHLPDRDDGFNEGIFSDRINNIDVPPGGQISLPVDGDLTEAAYRTVTVFYDKNDGMAGNWVNLGGRTDAKKKTVTVPFKGLGRYVAVNKVISFVDIGAAGPARHCVEYLWARGIMQPAENAPPGYLGLVGQNGQQAVINRGEFVVMLSKALGLEFAEPYVGLGIFSDAIYTGGSSFAQNTNGYMVPVPRDSVKYIETAAKNGLVGGIREKDGRFVFKYFATLTREQAAKIITAAAGQAVSGLDQLKTQSTLSKMYKDYQSIDPGLQLYVLAAAQKGYLQGYEDYTFRPKQALTRIEAAELIYNLMVKNNLI